ncbi:MAG: 4-alpha-glucanotransferase [Chloroflexi bacterium]|nr:4-alpha-glucanotransferase [Chloroflexota bacterium]
MRIRPSVQLLLQLARLYGVQTAYRSAFGQRRQASAAALLTALQALGAPVAGINDLPSAWRQWRRGLWHRLVEPVNVAWDGRLTPLQLRLPASESDARVSCHLKLESGEWRHWDWPGADLPVVEAAEIEGKQYVVKRPVMPGRLPPGYHRLTVELKRSQGETLIISAPRKAYIPAGEADGRAWGVFLPLYALHTEKSWGSGNFTDLQSLISWTGGLGGQLVATLPLLATFLDETSRPSPYAPVSRLFWSEFYLDIASIPELQKCSPAQALLASPAVQAEIQALRSSPLVDYHRGIALKRKILEEICQHFFAEPSGRLEELRSFAQTNPAFEDYARFRAACEEHGPSWRQWPQPLRDGVLREGDYAEDARRYYLYGQWLVQQQVAELSQKAGGDGVRLYLDLPLGVHPDGYDVWRQRDAFILDASAGAPPDVLFTRGQDWGFPPLHPQRIREQGYQYIIACLRHHLRHAAALRIDHVMGLHRLFCIPRGLGADQGVYVRYRAEEMHAILALESHRHQTVIVGEDLGTVPWYVRPAMKRHGLHRTHVLQFEIPFGWHQGPPLLSRDAAASLNTHDTPLFAAFWQGADIESRLSMGLLDEGWAWREREGRQAARQALVDFLRRQGWLEATVTIDALSVLKACLAFLAASQARLVLVNLEDLWLETQPQNVPSTTEQYPNWRRKARYGVEEFCQMPEVLDTLRMVNQLRKQGKSQP